MTEYALRLTNGTDTAARVRLGDALGLQHDGPLNARTGMRRDGGGAVTAVAGTMGVQVTPFSAWIDGGSSDGQGGYVFVADAAKTLTLSDGHATLARVDTIAAVVREDAYDGSGATTATLEVVEGTPGAGAPTLPTSCIPLRDVSVPAGLSAGTGGLSSSNLAADRRAYLSAGIVPVSGAAERDALGALAGQAVFRDDTGTLEVFDGTDWNTYKRDDGMRFESGTVSVSVASSSTGSQGVTFGTAFSATPHVVMTTDSTNYYPVHGGTLNASEFTAKVAHRDGTNATVTVVVHWIARGPA